MVNYFSIQIVRLYGSKNIGATNTYRVIGLKAALPVFFCDALKGAIGVFLFSHLNPMYMILGGILAMVGHNWFSISLALKVAVALQLVYGGSSLHYLQ